MSTSDDMNLLVDCGGSGVKIRTYVEGVINPRTHRFKPKTLDEFFKCLEEVANDNHPSPPPHVTGIAISICGEYDYVNEEVAENILDALPPACMRRDCLQLGEPHNHKTDEEGKVRATYLTLKKINDSVFEFCGYCFRGENTERGTEITYV